MATKFSVGIGDEDRNRIVEPLSDIKFSAEMDLPRLKRRTYLGTISAQWVLVAVIVFTADAGRKI
jgi:hypothetical protein